MWHLDVYGRNDATRRRVVMRPNVDGYVLPEGYDRQIEQGKIKKIPYLIGSNQNDIL